MSQERFEALLERLCAELPPADAADLRRRGVLDIEGTEVLLAHGPEGRCRLMIDFGPPPVGAGEAFYRRLLELNLEDAAFGMPVLSLHAESGNVVAILVAALATLEREESLTRLLLQIPALVNLWNAELDFRWNASGTPAFDLAMSVGGSGR